MTEPGGSAPRVAVRTLCFVRDGGRVLLQRKRRGIYKGLYNAPGGKVEPYEDPYDGCLRELREETGLAPAHARLRAVLTVVTRSTGTHWLLFIFTADRPPGEPGPIVDDEGELRWVPIDEVPSLPVVPDIPLILPHLWSDDPAVLMTRIEYATDDLASMLDRRSRTS
jgi:8-oxo-dGTP diphosphatase